MTVDIVTLFDLVKILLILLESNELDKGFLNSKELVEQSMGICATKSLERVEYDEPKCFTKLPKEKKKR